MIFLVLNIRAQEVRVYTSSPFISLNDKLQVILVLQGRHTRVVPQFPDIRGFDKIEEEAIVNMRSQGKETNFLQSYKPKSVGTFTVPSFPVKVGDNLHKTRSLIVKVEAAPTGVSYRKLPVDMSLNLLVDKTEVFLGEPVRLEAHLMVKKADRDRIEYDSYSIRDMVSLIDLPQFKEDRQPFSGPEISETIIDGEAFEKHILHRSFFIPLDTGFFSIENISLNLERLYAASSASRGDVRRNRRIEFRSEFLDAQPIGIKVKALPKTKLKKAHTVGELSLVQHMVKGQFTTGEPITLTLEVKGAGNISATPAPELRDYDNLLSFDPKTSYQITPGKEYKGQKNFIYQLIAAHAGQYDLGPVSLYFFNPEKEAYDSVSIQSIPISVIGDGIPQLLEVNALDKFYRKAFRTAAQKPVKSFQPGRWLVLSFSIISLLVMGIAIIRSQKSPQKKKDSHISNKLLS